MSADKTLADVRHGGRVRLGDHAFAQGCDELRMRTDGERAAYLEGVAEGRRAALSAQPSPGGQDALAEAARRVISDIDSGDYHGEISEATYAALEEALAARQPVGRESVVTAEMLAAADAYHDSEEYRSGQFGDDHTNAACYRAMAAARQPVGEQ